MMMKHSDRTPSVAFNSTFRTLSALKKIQWPGRQKCRMAGSVTCLLPWAFLCINRRHDCMMARFEIPMKKREMVMPPDHEILFCDRIT